MVDLVPDDLRREAGIGFELRFKARSLVLNLFSLQHELHDRGRNGADG